MHLLDLTVYLEAFSDVQSLRLTIEELDNVLFRIIILIGNALPISPYFIIYTFSLQKT